MIRRPFTVRPVKVKNYKIIILSIKELKELQRYNNCRKYLIYIFELSKKFHDDFRK